MKITLSKQQARHFLLRKQLLRPPRSLEGKTAVETVFNHLRLIQYDPLNPCGRNTDLVLQARIKDYHPNDYLHWLYTEQKGIECYDKELCIVPIEDVPLITHRQMSAENHTIRKHFIKTYKTELENVLKMIEKKGPVTTTDITFKKRVTNDWEVDSTFGRMALETLWKIGRLAVVNRKNGKKYYDLSEKTYGHYTKTDTKLLKKITEQHILRRIASVGMLPKARISWGSGWQGLRPIADVSATIKNLVQDSTIIEVEVEQSKAIYVMKKEDITLLNVDSEKNVHPIASFIAPLDNLIWDRDMILDLFDFHYRWEVYTPIKKRAFGYYVLPVLFGDRFIGRIEPILTKNNLEIKNFWAEKPLNAVEVQAVKEAVTQFQIYLNADRVIYSSRI